MTYSSQKLFIVVLAVFFAVAFSACAFKTVACAAESLASTSATISGIPDETLNRLLFHVSDNLKNEIRSLGGDKALALPIPILLGVSPSEIGDTWGEARAQGRVHLGTDIMAPRGELIVSPTRAVVTNIGHDRLGGNFVITVNPGGEQFYYAHLASAADNIKPGDVLEPGDFVGFVGNTGDARYRATHLHLGIYYEGKATNPYARLTKEFSLEERLVALQKILSTYDTAPLLAIDVLEKHHDLFLEAQSQNLTLPPIIAALMLHGDIIAKAHLLDSGITPGAENAGVRTLQNFLIAAASGPRAQALALKGATGHFGALTEKAIAEFQSASHIAPAQGHFGLITKSKVIASLLNKSMAEEQAPSQLSRQ